MALLVKDINCRAAVDLVEDYLEGVLSWRERRRLESHLASCAACAAYLEQIRVTIALSGRVDPEDLSADTLEALLAVFDRYQRDRGEFTGESE